MAVRPLGMVAVGPLRAVAVRPLGAAPGRALRGRRGRRCSGWRGARRRCARRGRRRSRAELPPRTERPAGTHVERAGAGGQGAGSAEGSGGAERPERTRGPRIDGSGTAGKRDGVHRSGGGERAHHARCQDKAFAREHQGVLPLGVARRPRRRTSGIQEGPCWPRPHVVSTVPSIRPD
jgi:hypothetical protein